MLYIYELRNQEGQLEYIGQSKDPKQRYYAHVYRKPNATLSHGRFRGRTDLELTIIGATQDRVSAHEIEAMFKKANNMPVGELANRRFTEEQVNEIRLKHTNGATIKGLAIEYGVMRDTINKIVKYVSYRY